MNRKPTKKTRGPNSEERGFAGWVAEQDCCCCHKLGPSIVQHCYGSTFRHNKILIGYWFLIPLCQECDSIDTLGSHKAFRLRFGPQSMLWAKLVEKSPYEPPYEVEQAIEDWNR